MAHLAYERNDDVIVMKGFKFARGRVPAAACLATLALANEQAAMLVAQVSQLFVRHCCRQSLPCVQRDSGCGSLILVLLDQCLHRMSSTQGPLAAAHWTRQLQRLLTCWMQCCIMHCSRLAPAVKLGESSPCSSTRAKKV